MLWGSAEPRGGGRNVEVASRWPPHCTCGTCRQLGAPLDPLPQLLIHSKPVCAATIRGGPGYLEVPFFATQDMKRNRGFGRALLEAIEDIARRALP